MTILCTRCQSDRVSIQSDSHPILSTIYRESSSVKASDWDKSYNIYCLLDEHYTDNTPFKIIAKFLRESKIAKSLSDKTIVYESHVRRFWSSVRYEEKENTIYSVVRKKDKNGQEIDLEIKFNVGDLRRVLELGDSDGDPTIILERLCTGLWCRTGFTGHLNEKNGKGDYDETSDYIMNIITCLVLNMPYNVSQVIFNYLVENIGAGSTKYIMYPRFIMMMIDDLVKDIQKDDDDDVLGLRNMTADTISRLAKGPKPRVNRMIYKINNAAYVAPENDVWRHENSNSENEDEKMSQMVEKKLRWWFVKDGKRKRTPKTSPVVPIPKELTPKIVVKGPSSESQQRLVDEPVLDPSKVLQQGADLLKHSLESFLKRNEEVAGQKDQSSSVPTEGVKETEPEGVAHDDSSEADDESTETETKLDMAKLSRGKAKLKKKPTKKKKGSDEEDTTYTPSVEETKKLRIKRKVVQTRFIPRNVRAKKSGATLSKDQSGKSEKYVTSSKPEVQSVEIPKVEVQKNVGNNVYVEVSVSTSPPPPPPENLDIPESSQPKKIVLLDMFEGFPNVRAEYKDDFILGDEFDMFHDADFKELKKKVSVPEQEKAKAEADRDELKKQLEELSKVNEEIKKVMIKQAKKIKKMQDDVDDNSKLFEALSAEITELHVKNVKLNDINKTLNQLISELHEASANEFKAIKLEMEAMKVDKAMKDEQLTMLYIQ
ncbi:hypothetical protein Hanom_Chr12g01143261 [Helianthus anomalus]